MVFLGVTGCATTQSVETSIAPTPTFVPSPPTSTPVVVSPPTPLPTTTPEPTPVRFRMSTLNGTPVPTATGVPATVQPDTSDPGDSPDPGDDIPPIPTAGPASTAKPIPTAAPSPTPARPTATPVPRPTPRPVPTPVPVNNPQRVEVGCDISPSGSVSVNQIVTLRALQSPADAPISYSFSHGDGTIDHRAVSQAYYASPGSYPVTLHWSINGASGQVPCGTVNVVGGGGSSPGTGSLFSPSHYVGHRELDAVNVAASNGFHVVRVARRDDQVFRGLADYSSTRLNIELDNGYVTWAYVG